jgi:hypothetical protein
MRTIDEARHSYYAFVLGILYKNACNFKLYLNVISITLLFTVALCMSSICAYRPMHMTGQDIVMAYFRVIYWHRFEAVTESHCSSFMPGTF